ncbi:response regulator transcription factor [Novosphingobium aerophilum]|uniref:response regulator transcription factor n=1 Tax=Novosphingobium TaxID=165696 RepID=UPI0006C89675|nr:MULTISPECIES: response regulator transcription factor [unclassified Novosphingobium]MPS69790.1 response regulator transcription factor [Novosphingobium sp.]TCM36047.1 two-component system OmpR family response regulator/two-component system response regulator QseB [Novosphingobium sp. ST904]WRT95047.1 response regulator transcription factor [Novosphingobium sp. RL4]
MPRLLVAEDDLDLGAAMKRALELDGYVVDHFMRGDEVLAAASVSPYDVILLDIGLPQMSGLEVLRQLRSARNTAPVIIITAFDRTQHRVAGLDAGADDYVVKPVDLEELAARIRSQLRRKDRRQDNSVSIGDVTLDFAGHVASLAGEDVALTAKEYRVLALLMRRSRRFVSKADLEGELYDQDHWVESNTVEVAISSLRRKFGRDFIRTARGLGYMVGGQET